MSRVVRVRPDVAGLDRTFDYELPDDLDRGVRVGTVVRVDLHGRRVRGWVTAVDVEPEAEALRPIRKVSSQGPPAAVVSLCGWVAWRWSGPPAVVLRAATPPNALAPRTEVSQRPAPRDRYGVELVVSPPATDRRDLVTERLPPEGSSIVVVPDAARAAAFARGLARSGRAVADLSAVHDDATRTRAWARAAAGGCIVVGGRGAVLAPVPDLAAIVVLDEVDEALKEERMPTWSAREVALERARREGARVTFVTAVPSVEALVAAGGSLEPAPAATRLAGWARLEVLDPRDEAPGRQILGDRLVAAVRAELERSRRVVCVLNRRGRARFAICDACGELARCEHCGAALAEVDGAGPDEALGCGRCGARRPRVCAACHGTRLRSRRPGVSRLRDDLAGLFPGVEVDEVDASSASAAAPLVIGTEAALHRGRAGRGRIGLVAFLDADQELLAPRYRAGEQAMWLLVRASRLVGGRDGRVMVQTRVGDHEVLAAAARGNVDEWVREERARREVLGFPPFGGLAELSGNHEAVAAAAALVAETVEVLGPRDGRALLRTGTAEELAEALAAVDLAPARAHGRLRVEVDPLRV